MADEKLKRWFRRYFYECDLFVVEHVMASQKGQRILTIKKEENLPEDVQLEVYNACEDDASGIGGVQKYALYGYKENEKRPLSRIVLRVASSEDNEEDGDPIDSEPPNKTGLTSQLMRHNEANMRTSVAATSSIISSLQRHNARLQEQNEKLLEKHLEFVRLIEELESRKHEREMAEAQMGFNLQQKAEAFEGIKMLVPAVVNKIAGKKLLPEKISPQLMQVKALAESLTAEQLGGLSNVLTGPQQISLMELMQSFAEENKVNGTSKKEGGTS